ncbi:MAG: hypothetical protein HY820_40605 [Acidobacteria bacterium]|nr:hypothetical protein [Acidobacteriota bacterium]
MKKFAFGFAVMALTIASAAESYRVTLLEPSVINGKVLKPGDYKVTVENNKATIKGQDSVEANVKVETVDKKFGTTAIRYLQADGKNNVQEIRVGNSKTKLVFANADQSGL